jgi:hypothetical protein
MKSIEIILIPVTDQAWGKFAALIDPDDNRLRLHEN